MLYKEIVEDIREDYSNRLDLSVQDIYMKELRKRNLTQEEMQILEFRFQMVANLDGSDLDKLSA